NLSFGGSTSPLPCAGPVLVVLESAQVDDAPDLLVDVLALEGNDPPVVEVVEPADARLDRPAGPLLRQLPPERDQVIDQAADVGFGGRDPLGADELVPAGEEPLVAEPLQSRDVRHRCALPGSDRKRRTPLVLGPRMTSIELRQGTTAGSAARTDPSS